MPCSRECSLCGLCDVRESLSVSSWELSSQATSLTENLFLTKHRVSMVAAMKMLS